MQVVITGATGFIGQHLTNTLIQHDYRVTAVSRDMDHARSILPATVKIISWDSSELRAGLSTADAVINLAGESIASGRWSNPKKVSITNSRLLAAQRLMNALKIIDNKKILFMQASAIGYYGNRGEEICIEQTSPGKGFLADVCAKWEGHVPLMAENTGRVITLRIGLVLGKSGGMLQEILKQSKRHMAGVMGNGKQWLSWIHIYDLIYAIMYLLNDENAKGPYNMVALAPVRQKSFVGLVSELEKRKFQVPAPGFLIKALLGEMGQELLLGGQKVSGSKLFRQGFIFKFDTLEKALNDILRS